jgi:hypothetical protein
VALIRRLWRWLRRPWTFERTALMVGLVAGLAIVGFMVAAIMEAQEGRRRLEALPEAERYLKRYELPDGTVCYESRYGYGISCLRP